MKKIFFIMVLVCLCACSTELEQIPGHNEEVNSEVFETHKIDGTKALEIANLYFNQTQTRSLDNLNMSYIINHTMTRSGIPGKDTLAYVLNRGVEDGFVIVSSDDRVYPILAHSETGTFKYEKGDIIDIQFISRLKNYFEENKNSDSKSVTSEDLVSCVIGSPALSASWNQRHPYNKYVIQDHPGCPVGCGALAAGMVMSHCKPSLTYHNTDYNFKKIRKGLKKNPGSGGMISAPERIIGGGDGPILDDGETYSYDVAADYAAELLYWIGKDINTVYAPDGSSASTTLVYNLIKNQGYKVKHNGFVAYNVKTAFNYLLSKCLVLMAGKDINGKGGHAWVGDGYAYCIDPVTNNYTNIQIHCDWGWGGDSNGYYTGNVFAADEYNYGSVTFFAVGVE